MTVQATHRVIRLKALAEHQRQACEALQHGKGLISRAEASFLHRVREQSVISASQRRYLNDLDMRVRWERSLADS